MNFTYFMKANCRLFLFMMSLVAMVVGTDSAAEGVSVATNEIVVVFEKKITPEQAEKIINNFTEPFREGMDSSKGKAYFYGTGPKYIVKVEHEKISRFLKECLKIIEIHECYLADWNLIKD